MSVRRPSIEPLKQGPAVNGHSRTSSVTSLCGKSGNPPRQASRKGSVAVLPQIPSSSPSGSGSGLAHDPSTSQSSSRRSSISSSSSTRSVYGPQNVRNDHQYVLRKVMCKHSHTDIGTIPDACGVLGLPHPTVRQSETGRAWWSVEGQDGAEAPTEIVRCRGK